MLKQITCFIVLLMTLAMAGRVMAGKYTFSVDGDQLKLNGKTFKILGLRCSNALISDAKTNQLINQLDTFKSYGVNTVSAFLMGSRFGDIKGYKPESSLDPTYTARLGRIIEAADSRGMVVLVGCLYWSTSTANDDLSHWKQADANKAIANTIQWLKTNKYRNVFVDVDNEGMAHDKTGWSIKQMIDAAHAVDPSIMIAYNDSDTPPTNADLYIHHSKKVAGKPWLDSESTPTNAPGGYWGSYSKATTNATGGDYYNYSRIGRYTSSMKDNQYAQTRDDYDNHNGHMLASTWIQCVPNEGVNGPHQIAGGRSNIADVNKDIDTLHPDAGILWWLEYIKNRYGAWVPPATGNVAPEVNFVLPQDGDIFNAPASLYVNVHASDSDGSVKNVKLYVNNVFVRQENYDPYEWGTSHDDPALLDLAPGIYAIKAVVTDNEGATTEKTIQVTVQAPGNDQITGLTLVNAATDTDIKALTDGDTINLTDTGAQLSIRAETQGDVGSIRFKVGDLTKTESVSPYCIAGDGSNGTDYYAWTPSLGQNTLIVTAFSGARGTGAVIDTKTVKFTVVEQQAFPCTITKLILVDAAADIDLGALSDGAAIDLSQVGSKLSIRAEGTGTIGSVRFALDGNSNFQTENNAPYAFAGDNGGDYNPWTPSIGSHSITATPYTQDNATGSIGLPLTITINVVN